MSLFAKIMVVVNFILAVMFLSAAGTFLGAMNKYKDMHQTEKDAHESTRVSLKEQVDQRQTQLDTSKEMGRQHEVARASAEAAQATQSESLKTLNEKNNQLEAALTKLAATYQTMVETNTKLESEKGELQDQVNTARADKRTALDDLNTANGTIAGLNQQVGDLEAANAAGQKANAAQAEEIDAKSTALALYAKVYGGLPTGVTALAVDGQVQAVDNAMDIYVISIGKTDKVAVGFEFVVYRGNDYVSTIVVDQVFAQHASCKTKSGMKKRDIQAGDKVSTRL